MSDVKRTVLIDIQAPKSSEAIANMAEARKAQQKLRDEIKEYRKELKELDKAEKENNGLTKEQLELEDKYRESIEENTVKIRSLNRVILDNQKAVAEDIELNKNQDGSIREMRASVAKLSVEWENLSQVEREGVKGQELQQQLATLNGTINEASLSTKNFKDNIGNYSSAMDGFIEQNTGAGRVLKALGVNSETTAKSLKTTMVQGANATGKAFTKLMANPLVAFLAVVVGIIMAIVKAVKSNQEAMDALDKVMAPVGKLVSVIVDWFGKLAAVVLKAIENLMKFFGLGNDAATQAVSRAQELEKLEIKMIKDKAKRDVEIANLEEELMKKEKYTHQERLDMAKEIQQLKEDAINEDRKVIQEKMAIWELEQKGTNTSREDMKEYAEMEAELIRLDANLADGKRRTTRIIDNMNRELRKEEEAQEAVNKAKKEAWKNEIKLREEKAKSTTQQLEDILLENLDDIRIKEEKALEINYNRRRDSILQQLSELHEDEVTSRENLNEILEQLDIQYVNDLDDIKEKHRIEDYDIEIASLNGLDNERKELAINNLIERLSTESDITKESKETLLRELNDLQFELEEEFELERLEREWDKKELELFEKREEMNDDMLFELELERLKHDELLEMDEETKSELFSSEEAYKLAVKKSRKELIKAEDEYSKRLKDTAYEQVLSTGAIAGSMSSLLSDVAGQSDALSKFSKALAIYDIATATGVGISKAIASGSGVPFPGNLIAIATGVGAVVSGMSQAYNVLKGSAPSKPSELGKSSSGGVTVSKPSVKTPSITPSPSTPSTTTDNPKLIRELGVIESSSRLADKEQHINVSVGINDINVAQEQQRVKEDYANL